MTVRSERRLKGRKFFVAKKRSQMMKAMRQQKPMTIMAMMAGDCHFDATEVARLNGRRKSAKPAMMRSMPKTDERLAMPRVRTDDSTLTVELNSIILHRLPPNSSRSPPASQQVYPVSSPISDYARTPTETAHT